MTADDPAVAIAVRDLRVARGGRPVLRGLDVDVPAGALTALAGPSGCGKTTLIRAIAGVQVVAGGRVTVLGRPAGARALRRELGYVTQAPSVYEDLSAGENVRYFGQVAGAPAEAAAEALATVGLAGREHQVVRGMSGGERARVSLAAALVGRPRVLLLDEPTVGLDPVLREELWQTFARLAAGGATLLVSTHVMEEAAECDRLLLMRDGALIADTTPGALLERTGAADLSHAFLDLVRGEAVPA